MRPILLMVLCWAYLFSLITSCKKDRNNADNDPPTAKNVYVLGVQGKHAMLWKNGEPAMIDSQANFVHFGFNGSSLAVSNGNTYISGAKLHYNGSFLAATPIYWHNGTVTPLTITSGNAAGRALFVAGADVYIAGYAQYPDTSHVPYTTPTAPYPKSGSIATLWKNGIPTQLPGFGVPGMVDSGRYAVMSYSDYVSSLYISGNDVYVSGGSSYVDAHASYWKNGTRIDLPGNVPTTTSIFVSGSDVYITGYEKTRNNTDLPVYWKNGTRYYLNTDSSYSSYAASVYVAGSDVFVTGWQNKSGYSRATLWKNGSAVNLTGSTTSSMAHSVFVSGKDVYVAGVIWMAGSNGESVAVYWKNGELVTLTDGALGAVAHSVRVE